MDRMFVSRLSLNEKETAWERTGRRDPALVDKKVKIIEYNIETIYRNIYHIYINRYIETLLGETTNR